MDARDQRGPVATERIIAAHGWAIAIIDMEQEKAIRGTQTKDDWSHAADLYEMTCYANMMFGALIGWIDPEAVLDDTPAAYEAEMAAEEPPSVRRNTTTATPGSENKKKRVGLIDGTDPSLRPTPEGAKL